MRLKTKLSLGIGFLFVVILVFGTLSIISFMRLRNDSAHVLKNNHETLMYCNNILKALDETKTNPQAYAIIDSNITKQEANITEPGEKEATVLLRKSFEELRLHPDDSSNYPEVRQSLQVINLLNQQAIMRKSKAAEETAETATTWLTIIFSILALIAFTLAVNFPSVISRPIRALAEGITAIAQKNYQKRIHLEQHDEFGELANAFNSMAQKLDDYESSNLAKIKFEKSRIETIINQMKDGIIGFDEGNNVLFINAVAEGLLGIREKDIVGRYAADIAVKNDLMRTLLQDGQSKKELKIYADNKESYFSKDVFEVKNEAQVIGQVIVLRNITPFHELNEAKTNFIATVSHELKTPLSSIKMSARLLTDNRVGVLNNEQHELIQSITDDADRLLKITGELLNMSQVETGNIQLRMQPASVESMIEKAVQATLLQAQQKYISIKTSIAAGIPEINADVEKTSWVLINFLTNAIKYSPESAGILITAVQQNGVVEVTVKDQGRGIDEKYLSRIFDRYFKVPGTHERTGTGLGLAISKEFIEAQGGRIWVNSKLNEGSEFGFALKVAQG
ncbi:sensor histidine kinase [Foetidibacter luteolus]|uniref:sensor histidine kinase n=1 Tax=Foetidibacter luteolus TaxID=2608880 RepID=UPI00129B2970|nr:ATP-binding protein [Foetidibacter luteolus]